MRPTRRKLDRHAGRTPILVVVIYVICCLGFAMIGIGGLELAIVVGTSVAAVVTLPFLLRRAQAARERSHPPPQD